MSAYCARSNNSELLDLTTLKPICSRNYSSVSIAYIWWVRSIYRAFGSLERFWILELEALKLKNYSAGFICQVSAWMVLLAASFRIPLNYLILARNYDDACRCMVSAWESRWLTQIWTMKSVTAMLKNYMVAGAYDWCVHLNKIFDYIYFEKIFQLKKIWEVF